MLLFRCRLTLRLLKVYPDLQTFQAAKLYWRPLNLKRSLPVLKWTSECEHFLS